MNSDAWLLDCGSGLQIAVGDREMIELVRQQDSYPVPGAPDYCCRVLRWQDRAVPVMDIALLHGARPLGDEAYVSVLNYLDSSPGAALSPVGIRVARAPSRIVVADSQVCAWPENWADSRLRAAGLCCFEHQRQPVMILDIARLCSAEFRELAAAA